jgi:colicin import membrane protein
MLLSVLLHGFFAFLLFYAALDAPVSTPPAPVAVELWAGAPQAAPAPQPVPLPTPAPTPTPQQPRAEMQIGRHSEARRQEASVPAHPRRAAPPLRVAPAALEKSPDKAKAKKSASHYRDDTNDLLAALGSHSSAHAANARIDQAGALNGVAGGEAHGSALARGNYAADVQARIKPLVMVPPDLSGNPKAVVQVLLWPTLEVRQVKLLQSSGSAAYDEAVLRAVMQAQTFPPLPPGANFADYRQLRLEFRPK